MTDAPGEKFRPLAATTVRFFPDVGVRTNDVGGTVVLRTVSDAAALVKGVSSPARGPVVSPAGAVAVIVSRPGSKPVASPVFEIDARAPDADDQWRPLVMV